MFLEYGVVIYGVWVGGIMVDLFDGCFVNVVFFFL